MFRKVIVSGFILVLLSACANTWSAKVTTHQNWPQDAGHAAYFIQPVTTEQNELAHQSVADNVRIAMGAVGLVEGDSDSRLQVSLTYDNPVTKGWEDRFIDPYGHRHGYHPHGFMWGWGGFGSHHGFGYGARWVSVPVEVYENTLEVSIKDKAQEMAEIYHVKVIHQSKADNLAESMPYLARAAFADFPGMNGKTQQIEMERNP